MPRPTFFIIDGHAHIYRAYFAPFRDLTSPTGEPTKATFVFTQMLLNLIEQRKPDYLAVVIDSNEDTTFRKVMYPQYKANRQSPPDDFRPQEQRIIQLVKDAGLPLFAVPGFEADDVLATLAEKLKEEFDIFLVSKDKDLRQVLTDHVVMYDPNGDEVIDIPKLREKVGYGPELAVEVQTLIGDTTDNVPGIPGVGEKTALQLLTDFGSVEGIYANLDKLKSKKKLVENLTSHRENLKLSRELVTLRRDVPFEFNLEACRWQGFNVPGLAKHLNELGFSRLLERVNLRPSTPAPKSTDDGDLFGNRANVPTLPTQVTAETIQPVNLAAPETSAGLPYTLIDTPDALKTIVADLKRQKRFAFDTETDSERPTQANLVGLSFSWAPKTGYYLPVRGPMGSRVLDESAVIEAIKPILEDASIQKVAQNAKYDTIVLKRVGIDVKGLAGDTMMAAFLLDASQNGYGIDSLALRFLNFKKIATSEIIGSGKGQTTMDCVDCASVGRYAAEDVDITLRLDQLFEPKLNAIPAIRKLYDELEVPLLDVLVEMESNGVRVDPSVLKAQSAVLAERIDVLRKQIETAAGGAFNPDSPKQLADVLFNKLGLPPLKKTKTGFSTDVEVLEKLAEQHAVPKLLLEYRSLVKLKNTYLDNLPSSINPRTGRIHTSFNMTGAATGRLSSSDPNLQNIPIRTDEGRRIRLAFVADPGHSLVVADYSQIELRILAHFTKEPALLRSFENDEDIHRTVASEVFGVPLDQVTKDQRGQAKTINFGIIYGVTAMGLVRRIEGLDYKRADELIKAYHARFPSISRFMQECVLQAKSVGYVETIRGRRRPLPDINSGVINIRNMNERMAINSVVQGTAADMIKQAMLNLHRRIKREKLPTRMLLQVHDELVLESPDTDAPRIAQIVKEEMQNAMPLAVPVKVEVGIGKNWDDAK
jgi:DNA polymerase I